MTRAFFSGVTGCFRRSAGRSRLRRAGGPGMPGRGSRSRAHVSDVSAKRGDTILIGRDPAGPIGQTTERIGPWQRWFAAGCSAPDVEPDRAGGLCPRPVEAKVGHLCRGLPAPVGEKAERSAPSPMCRVARGNDTTFRRPPWRGSGPVQHPRGRQMVRHHVLHGTAQFGHRRFGVDPLGRAEFGQLARPSGLVHL